jgi:hypothetical protein
MKAQICYESKTVKFKWNNSYFEKKLMNVREKEKAVGKYGQ